ncbi:hypothetical protein [Brevibacterium sp. ZH18]|uniref:hypothetical protein n=1 Tax=Brevibacterium sp. ZH18 TaxID=2927784 RepID=UPI001F60862B|nr:hypothetical protein [Brevibacterium sp. ZH18]MCI4012140.1 hypothetical protein [Brevibacterium sp. ZH18]
MYEYSHGIRWAHPFPTRLEAPGTEFSLVDVARGLPGTSLGIWCDGSERRRYATASDGSWIELPRTSLRQETVIMQDENSVLAQWDLYIDLPAAEYRAFPNGNLLIYSGPSKFDVDHTDDREAGRTDDVAVLRSDGSVVCAGTFDGAIIDIQITAENNIWVVSEKEDVPGEHPYSQLTKYSPALDLLWQSKERDTEFWDVNAIGESALIFDHASGAARFFPGRAMCVPVCCRALRRHARS